MTPVYTILAEPVDYVFTEKNSDFLCFLKPITERSDAMAWIDHFRSAHPNANHVCWAYVIGNTRQPLTQAFSDDGEPSGTAGKPMLHVLTEREFGNSLAVVVRYFGGVKLGAGGLVRAYSAAVSQAANVASTVVVSPTVQVHIYIEFAQEARLRRILSQLGGTVVDTEYSHEVCLIANIPEAEKDTLTTLATNETAGAARILINDAN